MASPQDADSGLHPSRLRVADPLPSPLAGELGEVASIVASRLDAMGVPYFIGGSIASSIHGVVRATADVDFVAFLKAGEGRELADSLEPEFYIAADAAEAAIRSRRSFNAIHFASSLKIDLFVPTGDPLSESAMGRAEPIAGGPDLRIATAEDVLVAKLRWARMSEGASDRQWSDVLGILRVAGDRLDRAYCTRMAALAGVEDLLAQALADA